MTITKRSLATAAAAIKRDPQITKDKGLVCVGYRWPSEKMGHPLPSWRAALPTMATWLGRLGLIVLLLGAILAFIIGVVRVEGSFERGDAVIIRSTDGAEIGRGLCAYDAGDAQKIKGRSSADIASILGFSGRTEMIHRDDLIVGRE